MIKIVNDIFVKKKKIFKLQWKIVLLVCSALIVSFLATNFFSSRYVTKITEDNLSTKVLDIARTVAKSEIVIRGLKKGDDGEIQVYADEVKEATEVGFVVILDMNLIRKSHPDVYAIGKSFLDREDAKKSLEGEEYVTVAEGVLGLGKRAFTPIKDTDGKQIGVVVVGISVDEINDVVKKNRYNIYMGTFIGLSIGILSVFALSNHIKRILFNLEPEEIATLLQQRDAMLQSVKEGIIAVDKNLMITLVNEEAMRIVKSNTKSNEIKVGSHISEEISFFAEIFQEGKELTSIDEEINGVFVLVNCVPIYVKQEIVGAIATIRDKTEVKKLSEEIIGLQLYTDALRAQSHEFMNKLHVILGMIHMGYYNKLNEYINQIVRQNEIEISFIASKIKNSVFAGFLLGKYSRAREQGIDLIIHEESFLPNLEDDDFVHQLIEIVGNITNNAIEALVDCKIKRIELSICYENNWIDIEVRDTGKGISKEIEEFIFKKGVSSKGGNRGLGLYIVKQNIDKLKGTIEISTIENKGTSFHVVLPYMLKGDKK